MLTKFLHFKRALKNASKALDSNEWPVGAVVVKNNRIIASAENMVERLSDPTAHAEILAANRARRFLKTKYLDDCTILVTLQPCEMCWFYLKTLRVGQVIWGASAYDKYIYDNNDCNSNPRASGPDPSSGLVCKCYSRPHDSTQCLLSSIQYSSVYTRGASSKSNDQKLQFPYLDIVYENACKRLLVEFGKGLRLRNDND